MIAARTHTLLATDFDGVLAPIVDDPRAARPAPGAVAGLARLGASGVQIVIVTGRPALTAVELGSLRGVAGLENLTVLGQYGVERWDASTNQVVSPPVPKEIGEVRRLLLKVIAESAWPEAVIEDKGRALAVHVRGLSEPGRAQQELAGLVHQLAACYGLAMEPGKYVLEVRESLMDKGKALRSLVAERDVTALAYAGDDLGDQPAFRALADFARQGLATWSLFVAGAEAVSLSVPVDQMISGPSTFVAWITSLADACESGE